MQQLLPALGHSLPNVAEMEYSLFHKAASGNLDKLKNLLESKVLINAVDYNERTALHLAAERGHASIIEYLLENGADHELEDIFGDTALDLAKIGKHFSSESILLEAAKTSPRQRSHDFLRSMQHAKFAIIEKFPRSVADALLDGRHVHPISKDMVTVLFFEVISFMETNDADVLSTTFSTLYRKFDKLAYMHGIQKVDIIGGVYIAAANFTEIQPADHAARIARFALEGVRAANETRICGGRPQKSTPVQVRAGMHSGPVSGCLVGSHGLKFTLMGDTVNVASRLQSNCTTGRIQCSEASARLIGEQASDIALHRRYDIEYSNLMRIC